MAASGFAVTVALRCWRRNAVLSIATGTSVSLVASCVLPAR